MQLNLYVHPECMPLERSLWISLFRELCIAVVVTMTHGRRRRRRRANVQCAGTPSPHVLLSQVKFVCGGQQNHLGRVTERDVAASLPFFLCFLFCSGPPGVGF